MDKEDKEDIYTEVEPSSIQPGKSAEEVTYDEIVSIITDYIKDTELDVLERQILDKGSSKALPGKLTLHTFIKNINFLMEDYIRSANKDSTLQQNMIIRSYFKGISDLSKVLDNIDLKVADTHFLCYIIGHIFKMLKHFKEEKQDTT